MAVIQLRLLDEVHALQFMARLLQEEVPVKRGLKGQYYVAHSFFDDLEAQTGHGKSPKPDINIALETFVKQFPNLPLSLTAQHSLDIEVKTFNWSQQSFSSVWQSYFTRKQTDKLFIGISPALQVLKSKKQTLINFEQGIITALVVLIMSITKDDKAAEIWKALNKQVQQQLPDDMTLVELPADRILEIINFKNIQKQDKAIEELKNEVNLLRNDLQTMLQMLKQLTKDKTDS